MQCKKYNNKSPKFISSIHKTIKVLRAERHPRLNNIIIRNTINKDLSSNSQTRLEIVC